MKKLVSILVMILVGAVVLTAAPASQKKKASTKAKTTQTTKKSSSKAKSKASSAKSVQTTASSSSLRNERSKTEREIKDTRNKISANSRKTEQKLQELNVLGAQIDKQHRVIASLNTRLDSVSRALNVTEDSIKILSDRIITLRKDMKSALREMRTRRQTIDNLSFVFSAPTFKSAMKRLGYLEQLQAWQNKKINAYRQAVAQVNDKRAELAELKKKQELSLTELNVAGKVLESRQSESRKLVASLRQEGADLQRVLDEKRQRLKSLDREIDRIIAEEQRRAEEKRRAEEQKRAEEQRRAEEKRLAEERKRAEQKGQTPSEKPAPTPAPAPTPKPTPTPAPVEETKVAGGSFDANKGRLMFPVAGSYTIVGYFGRSQHAAIENIEIENPGIDVRVAPGTAVRSVYEGTVSMVMYMNKYQNVVLLRHGHYLTVYAGLGVVNVKKGQTVKAGQTIGTVAADSDSGGNGVLHFEVRNERQKLNPLDWIKH